MKSEAMMRNLTRTAGRCLAMGVLVGAAVGCEPVDDGAATRAQGWDQVLTNNVLPTDRDVFTTIAEDPAETAADGCGKTEIDAHAILAAQCGSCHGPDSPQGLPPWDFVLDDAKMMTEVWTREGSPAVPFLKAGDPDNSAIFIRAATKRDMPPIYDISVPQLARVSYSGASVLREWITVCLKK